MGKSSIGWTDDTWNPVRGCSRVSDGCRHCYAEQQAARIVRMGKGRPTAYDGLVKLINGEPRWTGVVRLVPERLADPLRWRTPRRVFVNSMSDLFHEALTNEQIAAVFGVMAAAPRQTFQVLTKRAARMRAWFEWAGRLNLDDIQMAARREIRAEPGHVADLVRRGTTWPLPNVWLGVSVENQNAADERIPDLRATPAAVRFLSCEPLLGPLYLTPYLAGIATRGTIAADGSLTERPHPPLDWVIDGCESGPGARPAEDAWFESLAAQCRAASVPYFHKQQMVGGVLRHDVADFPPGLQIQEWPS